QLEGDAAAERDVLGQVHLAHRAFAEEALHVVVADQRRRRQRGRRAVVARKQRRRQIVGGAVPAIAGRHHGGASMIAQRYSPGKSCPADRTGAAGGSGRGVARAPAARSRESGVSAHAEPRRAQGGPGGRGAIASATWQASWSGRGTARGASSSGRAGGAAPRWANPIAHADASSAVASAPLTRCLVGRGARVGRRN